MGEKVCQEEQALDRELDPEVAARRNELFTRYVTPFYNMIYKLCIKYSNDSRNVEENYNEVLINFFRRIETYDPNRSIRTWLHICTKRHIFALERKRKALQDTDCDDKDIEAFEDRLLDGEVSSNVLGIDNYKEYFSDDVLDVLNELKPIHRDALLLQLSGYSLKEIVEIEYENGTLKTKNIETIKSRLFLARQYLRKHLTRDGKRVPYQADDDSLYEDSDELNQSDLQV